MVGNEEAEKAERDSRPFLPNPFIDSEVNESPRSTISADHSDQNSPPSISVESTLCLKDLQVSSEKVIELEGTPPPYLRNPFINSDVYGPDFSAEPSSEIKPLSELVLAVSACEDARSSSVEISSLNRMPDGEREEELNSLRKFTAEGKDDPLSKTIEESGLDSEEKPEPIFEDQEDGELRHSQEPIQNREEDIGRGLHVNPALDSRENTESVIHEPVFKTEVHIETVSLLDPNFDNEFDTEEDIDSALIQDFLEEPVKHAPPRGLRGIKLLTVVFEELSKELGNKFSSVELLLAAQQLITLSKSDFVGKLPKDPTERAGYYSWDLVRAFNNAWHVAGVETHDMDHSDGEELSPEGVQELRLIQQGWAERKWEF